MDEDRAHNDDFAMVMVEWMTMTRKGIMNEVILIPRRRISSPTVHRRRSERSSSGWLLVPGSGFVPSKVTHSGNCIPQIRGHLSRGNRRMPSSWASLYRVYNPGSLAMPVCECANVLLPAVKNPPNLADETKLTTM